MRAEVPVFSTGDISRMVTRPYSLEKANLVLFGSPNRIAAGDQELDSSIEEWKAGALAGVGLVTKALAERDWDLLGVWFGDFGLSSQVYRDILSNRELT